MAKRKPKIDQAEIVRLFGAKLREARISRGLTQIDLAHKAELTAAHVWRLETGASAPGIDLVERLAKALGVAMASLLPEREEIDSLDVFRIQAKKLFDIVVESEDVALFEILNPFLMYLSELAKRRS